MDFPRLLAALDIIRAEKISNEDRNLANTENNVHQQDGQTIWLRLLLRSGCWSLLTEANGDLWKSPMSSRKCPMSDIMMVMMMNRLSD